MIMDYTHLGLLSATITSLHGGLPTENDSKGKTFDGKTVTSWLYQNWPGVDTKADAAVVAQVLVTKSILTNAGGLDDRHFSETHNYILGVNTSHEVLVEHDIIERTNEELVEIAQRQAKKKMTSAQILSWLIKDLNLSRKHSTLLAASMFKLGLFVYIGKPPAPESFGTEDAPFIVNAHISVLPSLDDTARVNDLDHVPIVIGNNQKMDGVRLCYKGYLVAKYHNSPALMVSHVTEYTQVHECTPAAQQSPILHWASHKSIVFALRADGTLEGVDVESIQAQEYPTTTAAIAATVLGLLVDDSIVIGLVANSLVLWDRCSPRPPRVIVLTLTVNVPLAPDFCTLLPDNQILLVYTGQTSEADPVFTLWSLKDWTSGKVDLILSGGMPEPYGRITCVAHHKERLVFSGEKIKLMCWIRPNSEDSSPRYRPENSDPQFYKNMHTEAKASTLFIDSWFLLVGDASGIVSLHNRKTGERIYSLNTACGSVVNKIVRVGRWIFCAYDAKLAVFDIYRNDHPAPIQLYTSQNLPIRDFQVNPGAITLLLGGPPSLKSTLASTLYTTPGGSPAPLINTAGKTKVAVWTPKLDALDVYLKKPSLAQSHPILPALIYTYRRIVDILNKCVLEDVGEYRATLEWMRLTIDWIIKSSHERRDDDVMGIGGVPFLVMRALQLSGDKYCAALVKIAPAGTDPKQLFSRVLSSSRRRAEIDCLNSALYMALSEAVSSVGSGWSHINAAEPPFIDDAEGSSMWKAGFGASCLMADWSRFWELLRIHQVSTTSHELSQENVLRYILDPSDTRHVSQHRFNAFLRGFGPLSQCISRTLSITAPGWFVGYLSRVEGEILLQTQIPGTYMIRLSRFAHAFTISVMHSDGKVHHIVVDPRPAPPSSSLDGYSTTSSSTSSLSSSPSSHPSAPPSARPRVFTVLEAVGPERYFSSLQELILNYPHALRHSYTDTLHCMQWFQGDITSEEATHMLANSLPGTFLVHLNTSATPSFPPANNSHPGSHAAFKFPNAFNPMLMGVVWTCSVMGTDHTVHHLVITQHVEGYSLSTHTNIYPTLQALVKHYAPYGLLRAVETSCKTFPKIEVVAANESPREEKSHKAVGRAIPEREKKMVFTPTNVTASNTPPSPTSPLRSSGMAYTAPAIQVSLDSERHSPFPFPFDRKTDSEADVEGALSRAKSAIGSLRTFVNSTIEHSRVILLSQICLYIQRQLKSSTVLPPFIKPQIVNDPNVTQKQQEADRNVLMVALPHLEYLLELQAKEFQQPPQPPQQNSPQPPHTQQQQLLQQQLQAQQQLLMQQQQQDNSVFLNKVESILDAIAVFDGRRRPVIGGRFRI